VKARKVKKLDPAAPLADNLERIVGVRLDELCSFMPKASDPDEVVALHDMRIAAKRLRYILEVGAPCFGPYAAGAIGRLKELQDVLGEIHDCDEFAPRVEEHATRLRAEDTAALRRSAGARSKDLDPAVAREAPNRLRYRGLASLDAYLRARREVLYSRFLREWKHLDGDGLDPGLVARLRGVTIERRDGNG
jgi:CHAD domain-containing protein